MKLKILSASTLILILLVATITNSSAQTKQQRAPKPLPDSTQVVKMVDELVLVISLTEKQKQQVLEMFYSFYEKQKAFKEKNKDADRETKREQMQILKQEFEGNLMTVLSAEQLEKYKTLEKEKRNKGGQQQKQPQKQKQQSQKRR